MSDLQRCVLVVDDEALIALGLRIQVQAMGLTVCGMAHTAEKAIGLAQMHRPAVILMDMRLKGAKDGVDAALIINQTVGSRVIFITGSREPATLERIHQDHPFAVLFKPVSDHELKGAIASAIGP